MYQENTSGACGFELRTKKILQELVDLSVEIGQDDADLCTACTAVDQESMEFPDEDMQLLWEAHCQYIATEDKRQFKWHPK